VILLLYVFVLLPCYIPYGKATVIFISAVYVSTMVAVFLCLAAARWRTVFIEFCAPVTVLFRSVAIYLVARQTNYSECIPSVLDSVHRMLGMAVLLGDLIILRPNVYLTAFIVAPIQLILAALTRTARQHNTIEICSVTATNQIGLLFAQFPIYLPILVGVYLQTYNEARLFLVTENSAKQQQRMLEIFEKQEEGVLVFQKSVAPEDPSKKDDKDGKILFTNNAFTGIVRAEDARQGVET